MKKKYVIGMTGMSQTIPKKGYVNGYGEHRATDTMQVFEEDRTPIKTGLIDKNGRPIMRLDERPPIGFRWGNFET